jgi:hypothetical protein
MNFNRLARVCAYTFLIVLGHSFTESLIGAPEWTMLVYVQANNNLSPYALKNFSDMAQVASNGNFNALVQWFSPNHKGIWRYKITNGKMVLDECRAQDEADGSASHDLVNAMQWAVDKFTAQKYALILWNHGIGVLDPVWGRHQPWHNQSNIVVDHSILNQSLRIQLNGLTTPATTASQPVFALNDNQHARELALATATTGNGLTSTSVHQQTGVFTVTAKTDEQPMRGILFNEATKTYMDNQGLASALATIKTKVLKNKKIDLLGMDACLMAMVEVAYLARDSAEILVSSQEVELANGWNYQALTSMMALKNSTPELVAQGIVKSYEAYYKDKIQFYTQSAVKLSGMEKIRQSIDAMVNAYRICSQQDRTTMTSLAKTARQNCLQFSTVSYIDLHCYYNEFLKRLSDHGTSSQVSRSSAFSQLKQSLSEGIKTIEQNIIAYTAGRNLTRARGLSIYFPLGRIDDSYPRTEFARTCQWYNFIKDLA